jgi:amidophosphoribosyltransferase
MIKNAGAKEVHVRVASPPIISTCHFGVDTGRSDELIASKLSVEEIKDEIGADSLKYLSINGLKNSIDYKGNYCMGCFTKNYPIPVQLEMDKMKLEGGKN